MQDGAGSIRQDNIVRFPLDPAGRTLPRALNQAIYGHVTNAADRIDTLFDTVASELRAAGIAPKTLDAALARVTDERNALSSDIRRLAAELRDVIMITPTQV